MQAPQSALSRKLSREYPRESRRLNRAIRQGKSVKITLEDGSVRVFQSSSGPTREGVVEIDLSEKRNARAVAA